MVILGLLVTNTEAIMKKAIKNKKPTQNKNVKTINNNSQPIRHIKEFYYLTLFNVPR